MTDHIFPGTETGLKYPKEFIGALGETAHETSRRWLKDNDIPYEVIELIDAAYFLSMCEGELYSKNNKLLPATADMLTSTVPDTTRLIALCGGAFGGSDSTYPCKCEVKIKDD